MSSPLLTLTELGILLARRRSERGLSLAALADILGVGSATLHRLERLGRGEKGGTPDTRTLDIVASWLGVSVTTNSPAPQSQQLPDVIDVYLRADRHLGAAEAAALGSIFRTAYEQFSKPAQPHDPEAE